MLLQIPLKKVPVDKISISFTWDDNSFGHKIIIAPLFSENGFKCTFYINPGEDNFDSQFASFYKTLSSQGFEIGSHSYTHRYMALIALREAEDEFGKSVQKITASTGSYPITFAFPNHSYNDELVDLARRYHLETRNTLFNSKRFSIKTNTPLDKLIQAIDEAILSKTNLVFSGHSVTNDIEMAGGDIGEGYQPMSAFILSELLRYLKTVSLRADVITFSQASLREWIKKKGYIINQSWLIDLEKIEELKKFQITSANIISIL